jgi:DNA-binding response OmpR family regulator
MHDFAAPIRVLLVEPHADTRELYDCGLTAAGFDVQTADDSTSATVALTAYRPTIVVSEIRLLNLRALLTRCSDARVPVIALTTDPIFQPDVFGAVGIASVLLKPCLPDEIAAAIRQALGVT